MPTDVRADGHDGAGAGVDGATDGTTPPSMGKAKCEERRMAREAEKQRLAREKEDADKRAAAVREERRKARQARRAAGSPSTVDNNSERDEGTEPGNKKTAAKGGTGDAVVTGTASGAGGADATGTPATQADSADKTGGKRARGAAGATGASIMEGAASRQRVGSPI